MKVECPHLSHFPHLKHAFFEGTSDATQTIERMNQFPLPLITLNQVHGTHVLQVTESWLKDNAPSYAEASWTSSLNKESKVQGDGLVTNVTGVTLGIFTADCGPVLFYDPFSHIIGACHAGWRGARAGIIQETLAAMENLGAERSHIYATLGPTIQQHAYEVGPEFPDLIGGIYASYFYPSKNKGYHYFNLPLYIQDILTKEGIFQLHDLKLNTFSGQFASRRRQLQLSQDSKSFIDNLSVIAMN